MPSLQAADTPKLIYDLAGQQYAPLKRFAVGDDWVPSNLPIPLSRLPRVVDHKLILYVESVALSHLPGDQLIKVKLNQL